MKSTAALLVGVVGFALTLSALAQVYRWTDEQGRVHFSDKPPPDRKAEDISEQTRAVNVDTSGEERKKLNQLFAPETAEEKALRKQQQERLAAEQRQHEARCENARRELRFFREERFYWVDEEGNPVQASKQERQQTVDQLTAAIQRHCR